MQGLLNAGADINAEVCPFDTALQIASRYGQQHIFQMLLRAGAEVDIKRQYCSALCNAAKGGHILIMQVLVDAGAKVCLSRRISPTSATRSVKGRSREGGADAYRGRSRDQYFGRKVSKSFTRGTTQQTCKSGADATRRWSGGGWNRSCKLRMLQIRLDIGCCTEEATQLYPRICTEYIQQYFIHYCSDPI